MCVYLLTFVYMYNNICLHISILVVRIIKLCLTVLFVKSTIPIQKKKTHIISTQLKGRIILLFSSVFSRYFFI